MNKLQNLFDFDDYKSYFNSVVESLPNKGRGEYRRLSQHLGVSTTLVSQVFKGDKQLSLELAYDLSQFLGLDRDETNYFMLLVEKEKAGSFKLKQFFSDQIKSIQNEAKKLTNIMPNQIELKEAAKSEFYSTWCYTAVRLTADIPDLNDPTAIANRLGLPISLVQKVLTFLLTNQLLTLNDNNLALGPTRTHAARDTVHFQRHHQNWRMQSINRISQVNDDDIFFTAPMVLSKDLAEELRQRIPRILKEITNEVTQSPSETTRCLCIDWFRF